MTVEQILNQAHVLYDGSTDYPEFDDEDGTLRLALLQLAVQAYDETENIKWEELFTSLEEATDGDKVTTTARVYSCPANFRYVTSFVYIGTKKFSVIKAREVMEAQEKGISNFAYFTGKPGSYKLHISEVPEAGQTISYDYYRTPTQPTAVSDVLDMSRPLYAVYFIVWKLYENDNRNDKVTLYSQLASDVMEAMTIQNELPPEGHSNQIPVRGAGFGT